MLRSNDERVDAGPNREIRPSHNLTNFSNSGLRAAAHAGVLEATNGHASAAWGLIIQVV
jgi:hypothetical protein